MQKYIKRACSVLRSYHLCSPDFQVPTTTTTLEIDQTCTKDTYTHTSPSIRIVVALGPEKLIDSTLCCAVLFWSGVGLRALPYLTLSSLVLYIQGRELHIFEDVPHGHLVSIWGCETQVPRKHDMPTACDVV
jgi:hypothetical protein